MSARWTRPATVCAVLGLALSGSVVAAASVATETPGARLCVTDGQPVLAAKQDDTGAWVCGGGRTLATVGSQEAVAALDTAVRTLSGRLDALAAQTATSVRSTPVVFAAAPGGGVAPASFTQGCGTGRALSGSVKGQGTTVVQSYLQDPATWAFEVRATTGSPSATAAVVCQGAGEGSGGTTPGTTTPGTTTPGTTTPGGATSPGGTSGAP